MSDTQDKTSAYAGLEEADIDSYLEDILNESPDCECGE